MNPSDRVTVAASPPPLWMTVGEVAYALGVTVPQLREWVAMGCCPSPRYCGKLEAFGHDWWREWRQIGLRMPGFYPVEHLPVTVPGFGGKGRRELKGGAHYTGTDPRTVAKRAAQGKDGAK